MDPHPIQPLTRAAQAEEQIQLKLALLRWTCAECGAHTPRIYSTHGAIRYVKCRSCGNCGYVYAERDA